LGPDGLASLIAVLRSEGMPIATVQASQNRCLPPKSISARTAEGGAGTAPRRAQVARRVVAGKAGWRERRLGSPILMPKCGTAARTGCGSGAAGPIVLGRPALPALR